MRDHQQQKDHKQPMRLNHQGSSREKDDPIESFMEEKITIQNNQHFGQDQLWLKKVKPNASQKDTKLPVALTRLSNKRESLTPLKTGSQS